MLEIRRGLERSILNVSRSPLLHLSEWGLTSLKKKKNEKHFVKLTLHTLFQIEATTYYTSDQRGGSNRGSNRFHHDQSLCLCTEVLPLA